LWLKSQIERLLEPLFRLAAAEDITGIARGVAFQLMEALGVLERQKVAEDVKGLDQPARASLRRYGVRFGAYHIYLPALLKPAPRVLATQLWALKHGGNEKKGLEAIEQLAASGRTSIAADQDIAKPLYRIAGYRVCGARAVRVDILERLADLIRPALAWRSGATSIKPPGAVEGFGFTVTGGMTSLAGCSGENFASVLRSLGYRMERRPKPTEPAAATVEAVAQPAQPAPPAQELAPATSVIAAAVLEGEAAADTSAKPLEAETADMPPVAPVDEATAAAPTEALAQAEAPPQPAEEAPSLASVPPPEGLAGEPVQPAPSTEATAKGELAAEEFIEIWRPARRDEHAHKPRHERRARPRRAQRETQGPALAADAPAASAESVSAPAAPVAPARRERREAHADRAAKPERQRGPDRPERRPPRPKRAGHPQGDGDRSSRGDRAGRAPRGDRPDRDPALRAKYIKGRAEGAERREPDPNSPFAKLAALKEQLEASNKEPR
jgi:ATP-dependent RNA helicase SUPV3L1/SUV3